MTSIAIIYFSGTGTTKLVAETIARAAGGTLMPITGSQIVEGRFKDDGYLARLDAADAIVFGAPTYMGGPAAQFKAFADATSERWFGRKWSGKLSAGFTTSGSPSGDKSVTIQYLFTLAMQHGMLWIGQELIAQWMTGTPYDLALNRLGSHSGLMAQVDGKPGHVAAPDLETAMVFGERIKAYATKV